jgi:hypothetical protein
MKPRAAIATMIRSPAGIAAQSPAS